MINQSNPPQVDWLVGEDLFDEFGYPEKREDWKTLPANLDEEKLIIGGLPVMDRCEEPYMKELARIATSNGGRVLEVGFGMAISAGYIQEHDIQEHCIIEANADIFKRLEEFASSAKHQVTPLFGLWQDVVETLPDESFDGILFDPMPLSKDDWKNWHSDFVKHAYRLLKKGGVYTQYCDIGSISPSHREFLEGLGFTQINETIVHLTLPDGGYVMRQVKSTGENLPYYMAPIIIK